MLILDERFLTTLLSIRSCPEDLLILSFFTIEEKSLGVVGKSGNAMGNGMVP